MNDIVVVKPGEGVIIDPAAKLQYTKHFPNRYTVVATPSDYHVAYKIYEIAGWAGKTSDKNLDTPLYGEDFTEGIDGIDTVISGSVKWDGCSNWSFDETARGHMTHGCSKEDILSIGLILGECWEWTKELCPNWSY
jgi:hypothetical protein